MNTEEEKPLPKQYLRVRKEEDEDTWISGEELKTEGSSGSEDDVVRRKISPRKSRRRRSEGYTPPECRMSLPNLIDNKTGISFRISRSPDIDDQEFKGDRSTIGSSLSKEEEEKCKIEAALARMKTSDSLNRSCELDECVDSESGWRPKRGSLKLPSLEEGTTSTVES